MPESNIRHIAFIMDGNGRWATQRGLPREYGHSKGAEKFREIARYCGDIGIKNVTVYAFSTENWKRPKKEVDSLMKIMNGFVSEAEKTYKRDQMRIVFIGNKSVFAEAKRKKLLELEALTSEYDRTLCIALNYGGRAEIVHAAKELAQRVKSGEIDVSDITEDSFSQYIYTAGQPDPDIIVRPSGEQRLSNFLTWQSAYSEFWYSDVLWPDFSEADVNKMLSDYQNRHRRFGGI